MGQRCRGWIWCPWGVVYEARGQLTHRLKCQLPWGLIDQRKVCGLFWGNNWESLREFQQGCVTK